VGRSRPSGGPEDPVSGELRSILLGTAGLGVAALGALVLTLTRAHPTSDRTELRAATWVALATLLVQAAHFVEELATGFRQQFPEQLGLVAWPRSFFVAFNLLWLVVWTASLPGLFRRRRAALAALWFLGLAALANGVAHPLLALRVDRYFPGLLTSPILGVAGFLLLRRLARITRAPTTARGAA
jgi:hypothetical protein